GMPADIVVFDPDIVSGPADYNKLEDPRGIEFVLVHGEIVSQYGKVEAKFPGRPLRKRNESPLVTVEEPPRPTKPEPQPMATSKDQPITPQERKKPRETARPAQKAKRHKARSK
ncbi:MAG TPA: hypothetical protein VEU96_08150, partial [Bryobacteraceae bacterium]|nr:hypothetical protein [Bryobacteraceae bacterium]